MPLPFSRFIGVLRIKTVQGGHGISPVAASRLPLPQVPVILRRADAQDRAQERADHRDGGRDLRGPGKLPDLTEPRVRRADGRQNDDRQILEDVIRAIAE